jgi:uncharacterized iron-regulated membrane protein
MDYFHTDWAAMTLYDWLGLGVTLVVFFVMIGLYVYIFHPSNKEWLESQRHLPADDEHFPLEPKEKHK